MIERGGRADVSPAGRPRWRTGGVYGPNLVRTADTVRRYRVGRHARRPVPVASRVRRGPAEVSHQLAQRPRAVVSLLGVEPGCLVPTDMWPDDRTENLPEQVDDLFVIGQGGHPRLEIPDRSIVLVDRNESAFLNQNVVVGNKNLISRFDAVLVSVQWMDFDTLFRPSLLDVLAA